MASGTEIDAGGPGSDYAAMARALAGHARSARVQVQFTAPSDGSQPREPPLPVPITEEPQRRFRVATAIEFERHYRPDPRAMAAALRIALGLPPPPAK